MAGKIVNIEYSWSKRFLVVEYSVTEISTRDIPSFKKLIPFSHLFQILYELEKKSSLVTRALSAQSCTRDADSLHSAAPRARDGLSESLMQDLGEKALVPKLDSYISVHISADSCTLNLLYVISKLQCKIDQVS